jgi:peroxiredoxin
MEGPPELTVPDVETRVELVGADGNRLVGDRKGPDEGPPIVFLHGGGQTRHSWGRAADQIAAQGWTSWRLDARGHGESDWAPEGDYRLVSFARDLDVVVSQLAEPPVLVGASLGGLTSMLLAGELAPGCARAIVLVDIVPDMEADGALRIHSFMVERSAVGFGSLEEVADAIAAYNPQRRRPSDLDGLRKNLRFRDGRWYWHWDPAFMDGSGQVPAEITDVPRLTAAVERIVTDDVPVMLVRGAVSDLVSSAKANEFLTHFPSVEFADVSGAGHMVAGDRNDAFVAVAVEFLARVSRRS